MNSSLNDRSLSVGDRSRQYSTHKRLSDRPIPLQPRIERRNRERQLLQDRQLSMRMRQQRRIQERQQLQLWETGIAVTLTVVWTAAAIVGVAKLVPVQREQRQNLAILTREVEQLQVRVDRARHKVELGLDPMQSEAAIRESFNYMPYNQLGIVFGDTSPQ